MIKRSGRLMRGQTFQNVFEDHQAGDGIEGILTFLDNNGMIAIATAKHLGIEFAAKVFEILENCPESFF